MSSVTFSGELLPMRGGHAVAVDESTGAKIGARHGARVKGTLNGAVFRSNLTKMSGRLVLGEHRATVQAGVAIGDPVRVEMEPDVGASGAWEKLARSHRREYVGAILEAMKPETRARRVQETIEALEGPSL